MSLYFIGKEFVRFRGSKCGERHQYGNVSSFDKAKLACALDQSCIGFNALQPGCPEYRKRCSEFNLPKDDDFKLCMKNAPIKSEFRLASRKLRDYYAKSRGDIRVGCEDDCFHDFYVKSNEPGNSTII